MGVGGWGGGYWWHHMGRGWKAVSGGGTKRQTTADSLPTTVAPDARPRPRGPPAVPHSTPHPHNLTLTSSNACNPLLTTDNWAINLGHVVDHLAISIMRSRLTYLRILSNIKNY